jgi:mannose-6-phosphate isomerase-like protein (cupin superfamily)
MSRIPDRIQTLPKVDGPYDVFKLDRGDWEVRIGSYPGGVEGTAHSHPEETLGVVVKGELLLRTLGVERKLHPGDWYVLPAGQEHSARFEVDLELIEFSYRGPG